MHHPSRHLCCGSLQVIMLSEIGLDFCGARPPVMGGFERGSPWSPPSHIHVFSGYPFTSRPCSVWSLEAPRKCIPFHALSDHITLNPLGSMIPFGRLYCCYWKKHRARVKLSVCKGSFFPSLKQESFISSTVKSEANMHLKLARNSKV